MYTVTSHMILDLVGVQHTLQEVITHLQDKQLHFGLQFPNFLSIRHDYWGLREMESSDCLFLHCISLAW